MKPRKPLKRSTKPIRRESVKKRSQRLKTSREWFEANPPNTEGLYICYLGISPLCPGKMTRGQTTLEHVHSKVRRPDLIFNILNIKPSCSFCNFCKQSKDIRELAKVFPHIAVMINKPEWKAWERSLPLPK